MLGPKLTQVSHESRPEFNAIGHEYKSAAWAVNAADIEAAASSCSLQEEED